MGAECLARRTHSEPTLSADISRETVTAAIVQFMETDFFFLFDEFS